jgi:hypothetical protein
VRQETESRHRSIKCSMDENRDASVEIHHHVVSVCVAERDDVRSWSAGRARLVLVRDLRRSTYDAGGADPDALTLGVTVMTQPNPHEHTARCPPGCSRRIGYRKGIGCSYVASDEMMPRRDFAGSTDNRLVAVRRETARGSFSRLPSQPSMAESQSRAKRFFADRVIQQASSEGIPLSAAERQMLFWSESDDEFKAGSPLRTALTAELSDEEYEAKICGLLRRRFQADLSSDTRARERWHCALAVLQQGDHYITVMVDRAVGSKVKPRSQIWGVRAVPAALAAIAVGGTFLFAIRVMAGAFLGHEPSREELGFVAWVVAMALAVIYMLLRAALGGSATDGLIGRILARMFGAPDA